MNWNEEAHQQFYNELRQMDETQRSRALLDRAGELLKRSQGNDDLKSVESLLTYWRMHVQDEDDQGRADSLFYHLYNRMGEPERARKFKPHDQRS